MILNELHLKNYRNILDETVAFDKGINILYGKNANGKTNTVEAVYQFSVARSYRVRNLREVINFEKSGFEVSLNYSSDDGRGKNLGIRVDRHNEKKYFVNGIAQQKISDFLGNFKSVLFTPDNLNLIKGSPENRRRFIDMSISQIKPVYVNVLVAYLKILAQRNALLKQMKKLGLEKDKGKLTELSVWTEKMLSYSAIITRYRGEYAEKLSEYCPVFYDGLSNGRESVQLSYLTQIKKYDAGFSEWQNQKKSESLYAEVYNRGLANELRYGTSLYGPHRDDLLLDIDKKSARYIASQGQQRSAVLALKLSEGEIMKASSGEYPVFLFDDIMSELDSERQAFILRKLEDRQVIITCCNEDYFKIINAARIIRVEDGRFFSSHDGASAPYPDGGVAPQPHKGLAP